MRDLIRKRGNYKYLEIGSYLGGSISPGLMMRFLALHNFTGRLPLITPGSISRNHGATTLESIRTGVQLGIVHEMNGFISSWQQKYGNMKVVMTGGDAQRFAGHVKSSIFVAPELIHTGLNEILKLNV